MCDDPLPKLSAIHSTVFDFHERICLASRKSLMCSVAAASRTRGVRDFDDFDFFFSGAGSSSDDDTEYSPSSLSSDDDDSANETAFLARLAATRTSPGGCLVGLGGGEGDGMDPRKSPTTECVPNVAAALILR